MVKKYEVAIKNTLAVNEVDFDYQCTTIGVMIEDILNTTTDRNKKGGD